MWRIRLKPFDLLLGRFFGGVCVASIFFRRSTYAFFPKKWREKSTNNNASPMDLVVGAGTYWVVPLAGFRGSNGLLAHFLWGVQGISGV
jgi:hypothetical protein